MRLEADRIGPIEIFKIGIGPSSSHTVGPMVAALEFRRELSQYLKSNAEYSKQTASLKLELELYGSLSATGKGHGTDGAVCAGLSGLHPRDSSTEEIWDALPKLEKSPVIEVDNCKIEFNPAADIKWLSWTIDGKPLLHPNTMRFRLLDSKGMYLHELTILSVGGGFVENCDDFKASSDPDANNNSDEKNRKALPYPFHTAQDFVQECLNNNLPAWELVIANQKALGVDEKTLRAHLDAVLDTMDACIDKGLSTDGILPGGLNVRRRAKELYQRIESGKTPEWAGNDLLPSVYAMAVNEENAAGGRVVTAPTNGSSGLIPSVFRVLKERHDLSRETLQNGLIVASVIGALVKTHASISGAEVGCQGEVGTSCAMAAAGAVAMLGGNIQQIEQAAEIGIEHHLGMTCDPIKGLVQIPCIERNAMGAVKALNAAALALASDGSHLISLDRVLKVMKETGLDMNQKYKETSTGGLALG